MDARHPLEVDRWSRRTNAAQQLAQTRLASTDHAEHLMALRRLLARRFLVVPLLDLDNALLLYPSPTPEGLAAAVAGSLAVQPTADLPPAFRRMHEGGWTQGPGVAATLSDGLFEGEPDERFQLRTLLEDLIQTPIGVPGPVSGVPPRTPFVTSAELAARPAASHPRPTDSIPPQSEDPSQDRILLVYLKQRRRLTFPEIQATFFKGLKLLRCFGCRRFWLYSPGGFELDYTRDLSPTAEYAVEGADFFDRIAFLAPYDVALLLTPE